MSLTLKLVARISCESTARLTGPAWKPGMSPIVCGQEAVYKADAESISVQSFSAEASSHFEHLGWSLFGRICPDCQHHARLWRESVPLGID